MVDPRRHARLGDVVRLTKAEAFDACQVLADADRCLSRADRPTEAAALAHLFDLIESRLCDEDEQPSPAHAAGDRCSTTGDLTECAAHDGVGDFSSESGSYSRDREFTQ
jgi:hypothetical protein